MRASSPTHARQGPAGFCRISLPPGGDAPLSRLAPTAPLAGAPLEHRRKKASPARGGGCAAGADGGVALPRCLFRYLSGLRQACAGADDFHRPGEGGGCRKARGTMRASSPTNARQGPAGVCGVSLPPGGDAPLSRLTPTAPLAGALRLRDVCAARAGSDACISPRCLRRGQAAGRCEHRPLRMRGRGLPGFAGYLCRRAAMHPSVGWRRQLPLQGRLWNAAAKRPPLQGEVDAPQAQTEGCGALAGALRLRDVCAARRQARPLQFLISHSSLPQNFPSARRRASSVYTGVRRSQWGGIRRR